MGHDEGWTSNWAGEGAHVWALSGSQLVAGSCYNHRWHASAPSTQPRDQHQLLLQRGTIWQDPTMRRFSSIRSQRHCDCTWCPSSSWHTDLHGAGPCHTTWGRSLPCVGTGPWWGLPTVSGTGPIGLLLRPHDTGRPGFAAAPCHDLRGSEFCMELQQSCWQHHVPQKTPTGDSTGPLCWWLHRRGACLPGPKRFLRVHTADADPRTADERAESSCTGGSTEGLGHHHANPRGQGHPRTTSRSLSKSMQDNPDSTGHQHAIQWLSTSTGRQTGVSYIYALRTAWKGSIAAPVCPGSRSVRKRSLRPTQWPFALSPIDIAGPAASDQTAGDPTTTESAGRCDLLWRLLRHRRPDTLTGILFDTQTMAQDQMPYLWEWLGFRHPFLRTHPLLSRTSSSLADQEILHTESLHLLSGGSCTISGLSTLQAIEIQPGVVIHRQYIRLLRTPEGILQGLLHMQHDSFGVEDHRTRRLALAPGVGTIRYEHQRSGVQTPIQRNGRTWRRVGGSRHRQCLPHPLQSGHRSPIRTRPSSSGRAQPSTCSNADPSHWQGGGTGASVERNGTRGDTCWTEPTAVTTHPYGLKKMQWERPCIWAVLNVGQMFSSTCVRRNIWRKC